MSRNPDVSFAQKLRTEMTETERILWPHRRRKRLRGLRFRRQHPIGKYIVDFICLESLIVIELDGSQHLERESEDRIRDAWLETQGYKVLRFYNNEFLENRAEVLELIASECLKRHPHPPLAPSPLKGEGRQNANFTHTNPR